MKTGNEGVSFEWKNFSFDDAQQPTFLDDGVRFLVFVKGEIYIDEWRLHGDEGASFWEFGDHVQCYASLDDLSPLRS